MDISNNKGFRTNICISLIYIYIYIYIFVCNNQRTWFKQPIETMRCPTPLVHLMRFVKLTLGPVKALHVDEKSETCLSRVSSINLWTRAQGSGHPISMCMPLLIPTHHHLNTCPTLVKTSVGHSRYQKPWTWNSQQIAFSDSHSNQNMKPVLGSKGRSEVGEEVTRDGDLKT